MNKQEAAEFLGVTTRSLERYVSQNKLKVKYVKGKTRSIAMFEMAELEKLKQEMASMPLSQRLALIDVNGEAKQITTNNDNSGNGVMATKSTSLTKRAKSETVTKPRREAFSFADLDSSSPIGKMFVSVMANNKMVVTLAEAAALTSLSQKELRKAIHTRELKAGRKGRGWKIRRKDLEAYVERLW